MMDQYGDIIPDDLVVIPEITGLTDEGINLVDAADWYLAGKLLLVSGSEINYLSEINLEDVLIDIPAIQKVDRPLHRYNLEDGFYTA